MPKVKKKKATKTPRLSMRSADVRGYARTLGEIKQHIKQERLRVVLAANTAKAGARR